MAEMLILEFSAPSAVDIYNRVNELIGVDPTTSSGEWPAGMLSHHAGSEGDSLVVVETWESREAEEEFMRARLMPAFEEAHVPQPTRVTWLPEVGRLIASSSGPVPQPRAQASR
jgi:hypothetical protein